MSDQHVSAYQQLLAATDAIGEVGRASSARLKHTLEHALVCMLAALDLPEGAIYLYSPQMNNLALAAAVPSGGVIANQGTQLRLTNDQMFLPVIAAMTHTPAIGDAGSGIENQPDLQSPTPSPQSIALPLLADARLMGVIQVAGRPGESLSEQQHSQINALAERLARRNRLFPDLQRGPIRAGTYPRAGGRQQRRNYDARFKRHRDNDQPPRQIFFRPGRA